MGLRDRAAGHGHGLRRAAGVLPPPLVGYSLVALSTVLTMVLGFGVWVHHMFAHGPAQSGALLLLGRLDRHRAAERGDLFAWTATIWTGRPVITTAFLFFSSMIVLFVIGGVSGFVTGAAPVDWQLTDTCFVVAHIHYVLIGINVFPVAGALYFFFPKFSGRMMDERLGRWNFWTRFLGFNIGFLPMHLSGLLGMPPRVYPYGSAMGWTTLNMITTIGSFIFAAGVLLLFINVFVSLKRGKPAGPNRGNAPTLEWSDSSQPPEYNFAVIPQVASRHPLWEDQLDERPERSILQRGMPLAHGREALAVTTLDSEPEAILKMPEDSVAPFILTVGLSAGFTGRLVHLWWLAIVGFIVVLVSLLIWLWPRRRLAEITGSPR